MVVAEQKSPRRMNGESYMEYVLLLYSNQEVFASMPKEMQAQGVAAYEAFTEALREARVLRGVNRLAPSSAATTVSSASGKNQVLNGPYVDSKEQLGGYYVIDVPDLDAALSWAARCPGASHGTVEVRPVWTNPD
jgi:hypothetical protein